MKLDYQLFTNLNAFTQTRFCIVSTWWLHFEIFIWTLNFVKFTLFIKLIKLRYDITVSYTKWQITPLTFDHSNYISFCLLCKKHHFKFYCYVLLQKTKVKIEEKWEHQQNKYEMEGKFSVFTIHDVIIFCMIWTPTPPNVGI